VFTNTADFAPLEEAGLSQIKAMIFKQSLNSLNSTNSKASGEPLFEEAGNSVQVLCDKQLTIYLLERPKASFCKLIRQGVGENLAITSGEPYFEKSVKPTDALPAGILPTA
jgi:hypothetical protein